MRKLRSSVVLCATICAVIVLALTMSAITYGSVHIGPWPFPPDDPPDGGGNIALGVHIGPWPFPPDDPPDGGGSIALADRIGPWPFPPDDPPDGGGNFRLV
jgi:hypothetical protein